MIFAGANARGFGESLGFSNAPALWNIEVDILHKIACVSHIAQSRATLGLVWRAGMVGVRG